jgi:hypothetical protein
VDTIGVSAHFLFEIFKISISPNRLLARRYLCCDSYASDILNGCLPFRLPFLATTFLSLQRTTSPLFRRIIPQRRDMEFVLDFVVFLWAGFLLSLPMSR